MPGFATAQRFHGVVVPHPLRMRKALGLNRNGPTCLVHVCGAFNGGRRRSPLQLATPKPHPMVGVGVVIAK